MYQIHNRLKLFFFILIFIFCNYYWWILKNNNILTYYSNFFLFEKQTLIKLINSNNNFYNNNDKYLNFNNIFKINNFFLLFFLLFFVLFFCTLFYNYLGFIGVLYLIFFVFSIYLFIIYLLILFITRYNIIPFLEIKIYSIYIPTFLTSIVFSFDYISIAFFFLVICIAMAAILYTYIYLINDANSIDFLIKLMWFVFSMLSLVISKNFIFLYFSWEFIGITSMWLINFNSMRLDTNKSALKAFTFNKVSDLCLFSALLLGAWIFNTSLITDWRLELFTFLNIKKSNITYLYIHSILLVIAASIKSAQLGFHLWLPDSMDAPVPASALIHSATLVSAGVYLLLRFLDLLQINEIINLISILGALTATYGGIVAALQTDLKKALAYSTISHCGFLFITIALGGLNITLLYLFLHGFYKALSFIHAGECIRYNNGYQDLNKMGGLFFLTPNLTSQFSIAMGALCGLPFFLGYIYKYNFQFLLISNPIYSYLFEILLIIGFLSSLFYFIKIFYLVVFSFKKNYYKSYNNIFEIKLYNWKFSIKTPKILIFIFWFIIINSIICIYIYFNYRLQILNCSYLNFLQLNLNFLYNNMYYIFWNIQILNYFLFFYIFFFISFLFIWLLYQQKRCVGNSTINNFIYYIVLINIFFIII